MSAPGTDSRRLAGLGLAIAALSFGLDQTFKWWMLGPFDIAARQPVEVTGFLDLVLVWNRGISYGLFASHEQAVRLGLIALALAVSAGLAVWLVRARSLRLAAGLGLVIGGALANMADRMVHGAVADFFLFHAAGWNWYVFNLADCAIVAGVALLLYDSFRDDGQEPAAG
jgi:signal peptidase II